LVAVTIVVSGLAAGCGPPFNKKVEGVVTLDGKPLANVLVQFVPLGSTGAQRPISSGTTDADGSFKLTSGKNKNGAIIGKHKVVIMEASRRTREGRIDGARGLDLDLPLEYSSAADSPIEVDVTSDKHTYEFNLRRSVGE